jgi:hypothetical protein
MTHQNEKSGLIGVPTMVLPGRGTFVLEIGTFPLKAGRVAINSSRGRVKSATVKFPGFPLSNTTLVSPENTI